jgi:hypothetical protein
MADPIAFRQRVVARALVFAAATVLALVLAAPSGCSSSSSGSACGSPGCAAGNDCIDDGSGPACHQVCTSSADCPFNWSCNDNPGKSFCVESTYPVMQLPMGQWGTPCLPSGGEQSNKACDTTDQFSCYGNNPTDANAFCTIIGCVDTDCPGGWWCATVNAAPNVTTNKQSFGPTRPVCMPRAYCAPCRLDHDCPAASDGTEQHCVKDTGGDGYCTPTCGGDANCPIDATCTNWQSLCTPAQGASCRSDDDCSPLAGIPQHCDNGKCSPECGSDADCASVGDAGSAPATCAWRRTCTPRAGVCLGNGGFCSPCRSDLDCKNGYCLSGMPYSTERFCSVKSTTLPCDTTTLDPPGCPKATTGDNWLHSGCTTSPANQCEGLVTFGTATGQGGGVPGCWTQNR